jgi:uncharacterized membrane protein HdeD (DUF308 family)
MDFLARYWWLAMLRGVLGIVLAVLAFALPIATLTALVMLFGAFALVDGAILLVVAARGRHGERRWPVFVPGGLGLICGLLALAAPFATALALVFLVAAWAIATGIFQIVAALRLPRAVTVRRLFGMGGTLSVAFGLLLALFPRAGLVVLVWAFGLYWLLSGIALVWLGSRLRRAREGLLIRLP